MNRKKKTLRNEILTAPPFYVSPSLGINSACYMNHPDIRSSLGVLVWLRKDCRGKQKRKLRRERVGLRALRSGDCPGFKYKDGGPSAVVATLAKDEAFPEMPSKAKSHEGSLLREVPERGHRRPGGRTERNTG